jgi:hypothetical protein
MYHHLDDQLSFEELHSDYMSQGDFGFSFYAPWSIPPQSLVFFLEGNAIK